MTGENAAAERRHRSDLAPRKIRIPVIMTWIGDLDADGARVDVARPRPGGGSGMPSASRFGDKLDDVAVRQNHVMGGYLGCRRAKLPDRGLIVRHACIVQDDHVGRRAIPALAVIR
jgi:hypothetical protein